MSAKQARGQCPPDMRIIVRIEAEIARIKADVTALKTREEKIDKRCEKIKELLLKI